MKWSIGWFRTFVGGERAIDVEYKLFIKNTCPFERKVHDTHTVCDSHRSTEQKKKRRRKGLCNLQLFLWMNFCIYNIYMLFIAFFSSSKSKSNKCTGNLPVQLV